MKTNNTSHFVLFLLAVLIGFGCSDGYKQGTPQKLGESFYLALKNNDPEGFRSLMVQDDDLDVMMEIADNWDGKSEEEIQQEYDWSMRNLDNEVPRKFAKMRKRFEDAGGDWESLEYKGVDVKKSKENGFEVAHIRIYFSSNGKEFELDGEECANLKGKWVGGEMGRLNVLN